MSESTAPLNREPTPAISASEAGHRVILSADESQAIDRLHQTRPEMAAPFFLITDLNRDPDDLTAIVMMKHLQDQGFIDLRYVVTTLGDIGIRTTRARFARSVLDDLGLKNAKVAVGVEYAFDVNEVDVATSAKAKRSRPKSHNNFLDTSLLRQNVEVEIDGLTMVKKELESIRDHSAVFLINAGMPDMVEILRELPDLVQQKTARVVVMGGVKTELDSRGFVVADETAYNNMTHQPSANYVYARVQELGIPFVILNRDAAYIAAVPQSFYDGMAATGHPIGVYLKIQQMRTLRNLWEEILEGQLPPDRSPEWFFKTFTSIDLESPSGSASLDSARAHPDDFEAIWKLVSKLNLYDPLSLLSGTPGAAEVLFQGEVPIGARSQVKIYGSNAIKDVTLMKNLLAGLGIESLNSLLQ